MWFPCYSTSILLIPLKPQENCKQHIFTHNQWTSTMQHDLCYHIIFMFICHVVIRFMYSLITSHYTLLLKTSGRQFVYTYSHTLRLQYECIYHYCHLVLVSAYYISRVTSGSSVYSTAFSLRASSEGTVGTYIAPSCSAVCYMLLYSTT